MTKYNVGDTLMWTGENNGSYTNGMTYKVLAIEGALYSLECDSGTDRAGEPFIGANFIVYNEAPSASPHGKHLRIHVIEEPPEW